MAYARQHYNLAVTGKATQSTNPPSSQRKTDSKAPAPKASVPTRSKRK